MKHTARVIKANRTVTSLEVAVNVEEEARNLVALEIEKRKLQLELPGEKALAACQCFLPGSSFSCWHYLAGCR
jgi:hypothetical protein